MRTMAKHRFQHTRKIKATRFWLFAALLLIWGVSPGRAGQQSAPPPTPRPKAAPKAGQKMARPTPEKSERSAKTPAQHRNPAAASHSSPLAAGKRDPFKIPEVSGARAGAGTIVEPQSGALPQGKRGLLI